MRALAQPNGRTSSFSMPCSAACATYGNAIFQDNVSSQLTRTPLGSLTCNHVHACTTHLRDACTREESTTVSIATERGVQLCFKNASMHITPAAHRLRTLYLQVVGVAHQSVSPQAYAHCSRTICAYQHHTVYTGTWEIDCNGGMCFIKGRSLRPGVNRSLRKAQKSEATFTSILIMLPRAN